MRHASPNDVRPLKLERSFRDPRTLLSSLLSIGTGVVTVIACVPLFSVLIMLIWRGGAKLTVELFTSLPPTAFEDGGGTRHYGDAGDGRNCGLD